MRRHILFLLALVAATTAAAPVKLARYPHYHQGRIVFTYLGDVWTAHEDGTNVQRLTVHVGRDVYPRFSPDGKWIAFSSERYGNLDVFLIPSGGGAAKQLTFHSADDAVLGWTPDSRAVLFSSQRGEDFAGKLYTVSIDGGLPKNAGADMGVYAGYSPDGSKLVVNRKSQVYWRKFYRGSNQSDVTVVDLIAGRFRDLTEFDGQDSWPMWSTDGHIYFVSDRSPDGVTNIWRVPAAGGNAEQVSMFRSGDVRWPALSADGKVIVFEHDFEIYKLDLATRRATPIKLDIAAETQGNLSEIREFRSEVDDYDLEPAGRRIVFSIHGEIFTAPVEQGDLRQITASSARDQDPQYSPDGKWVAFISDRDGREELYVAKSDGTGEARRLTEIDALKNSFAWSPDSREIAFTASDNKLRKLNVESRSVTELSSSRYGNVGGVAWSPDGKWLAFSKPDQTRASDIYLVAASGGQERKVSFDSYGESQPRFSADGKKLYFVRTEGLSFQSGAQLWAVTLERELRDPDDPEMREERPRATEEDRAEGAVGGAALRRRPASRQPVADVQINWAGLERRTRQVTRMPFAINSYTVAPEGRLVFVTSEPAGRRNVPVIYVIQDDGRRLTRVASGTVPGDEEDDDGPGGFFGGGGLSALRLSADGRTLFFREGDGVYSVGLPAPAREGAGPSSSAPSTREGAKRRINFTAKVQVDYPAEWTQMFDDAWRTMKYRFYDQKMHGKDWDAARAKYRPLVSHVGDRQELLNIVNEMIGELNASHTGSAPPRRPAPGAVSTGYLGLDLEADEAAGRYRVTHIYKDGPADKDWVRVNVGDYLVAINGQPVRAGDNYWQLLNHRLNRRIEVSFNSRPSADGAWSTRIAPITQGAFNQLRYERWVTQRRDMVAKLSDGRLGYVHIQAMNQPSLRRFEKELREYRDKEALVIDQRWNGGGNIEQELLAILVQRPYQVWQPRGTEPNYRPFAGYFGPKVVLQNFRSGSNAEMFPAGFRALGLGKVIGTHTAGAVIGTGSYSLIDGSTVRTPGVAVYLNDEQRTNMENFGVPPDIAVDNSPEDNLSGRDRQLEVGVEELLKEINRKPRVTAGEQ